MSNKQTVAFVYGGVAAVLLLCLFDMPYGFYAFVRFAATAAFCYLAFKSHQYGEKDRMSFSPKDYSILNCKTNRTSISYTP